MIAKHFILEKALLYTSQIDGRYKEEPFVVYEVLDLIHLQPFLFPECFQAVDGMLAAQHNLTAIYQTGGEKIDNCLYP